MTAVAPAQGMWLQACGSAEVFPTSVEGTDGSGIHGVPGPSPADAPQRERPAGDGGLLHRLKESDLAMRRSGSGFGGFPFLSSGGVSAVAEGGDGRRFRSVQKIRGTCL